MKPHSSLRIHPKGSLLKEWDEHGHVHENYNGDTGYGCDKPNSNNFYHWGGLLGHIAIVQSQKHYG